MFSQLEDLVFAEDIVELSTTSAHFQKKTNILNNYVELTGNVKDVEGVGCVSNYLIEIYYIHILTEKF